MRRLTIANGAPPFGTAALTNCWDWCRRKSSHLVDGVKVGARKSGPVPSAFVPVLSMSMDRCACSCVAVLRVVLCFCSRCFGSGSRVCPVRG